MIRRQREALRRGSCRAVGVALACALLAAQTPAAQPVFPGVAAEGWMNAASLSVVGDWVEGLRKLVGLKRLPPREGIDASLPPPVLEPARGEEKPRESSAATSSLPTFRASLPAAAPPLDAPTNLAVTQASATQINLVWTASAGAHHYRVERGETMTGGFTFVADSAQNSFQDTTVPSGPPVRAYLYRVFAVDSVGSFSPPSNLALGTAVTFTDPLLTAQTTSVKTEHVGELRGAVNAVRRAAALPEFTSWTDNALQKNVTPVKAAHVQQLRDSLNEALSALSISWPAFTDPNLGSAPNGLVIKKVHFDELRERATRGTSTGSSSGISVVITSPANNTTFGEGSNINLSASVTGGTASKVEFFAGAAEIGEDTTAPYSLVWNAPEGSHSVTAVATSTSGGTTSSPPVNINVLNFTTARLDPSNRVGGDGVDLASRNFNWTLPVVNLPGRAGHDLNLSLSYNSLVWTKSGSWMLYDGDWGFPAPGFRLGFPLVQQKFYNAQAAKPAYLLIAPSGERVELRQTAAATVYEAVDSSYIQLTENGDGTLTVRTTDGGQMAYVNIGGAFRCTEVKDRNGNFITVNHDAYGNVQTVMDTAGRTVNFNYDGPYLQSITQTWQRETAAGALVTETRNWARFYYQDKTIQTSFAGVAGLLGAQNGQTVHALTSVKLDDDTTFTFNYTTWGQVNQIAHYAADNHLLNYVTYNLPPDAAQAQGDCPRFTQKRVWAEQWNGDDNGTPVAAEEAVIAYSEFNFAGGVAHATLPDGTRQQETFATSGWQRGLATRTETFSADDLVNPKKWTTLQWTQDDTNLAAKLNPRVEETHIHDSFGNHRRTRVTYTSFGLPLDVFDYDTDATTVLRRTRVDYLPASVTPGASYANRRLIGLPSEQAVYGRVDGQERLVSKNTFEYDLAGEFLASAGTPTRHDSAGYGTGFVVRGNACRVWRWDVNDPNNPSKAVKTETGYNTTGSTVFTRDALNHQTTISYADSNGGNTLAYPTSLTDPDNHSSSKAYNYGLGLVTRTVDPKGSARKTLYDARGRAESETAEANGGYKRWEYPASGRSLREFTIVDTGASETSTTTVYDGAGRVRATLRKLPANYVGQRFVYDALGRQTKQSNPMEVSVGANDFENVAVWVPAGDDAGAAWKWTEKTFDWNDRPLSITNPGTPATTKEFLYGGCGCAGGDVVTTRDEVGRRRKVTHDAFGRAVKTQDLTIQDKSVALSYAPDGSDVYRTTAVAYDALDRAVLTEVYAGANETDPAKIRRTTTEYDGHGRLWRQHAPTQDADKFTENAYNPDDTLLTTKDARGAKTVYGYNNRHQQTSVSYDLSEVLPGQTVPATSGVTFEYDAAGNRTLMTDGAGSTTYHYDTLSRLDWEERRFNGLAPAYRIGYAYTLSGQLKSVSDPFNASFTYQRDTSGRLTGVTGSPYAGVSTYVSNVTYRAWGAVKSASFGNGYQSTIQYNDRMQATQFRLTYPAFNTNVMREDFSYYADGRLATLTDLDDTAGTNPPATLRFLSRSYFYDLVGRVTFGGGPGNLPFTQSYSYDVFDNMTARSGSYYNFGCCGSPPAQSHTYTYTNNRRDGWTHDADGRVTFSPATSTTVARTVTYDAAGRLVTTFDNGAPTFTTTYNAAYDGDGRIVAETKHTTGTGGSFTSTYSVRATALGGEVLTTLNASGGKEATFVPAQGLVYARQWTAGGGFVGWVNRDPVGLTESNRGVYDPLGEFIPFQQPPDPRPAPGTYSSASVPGVGSSMTDPQNFGFGCVLDGMPTDCSGALRRLNNGTARLDPRMHPLGMGLPHGAPILPVRENVGDSVVVSHYYVGNLAQESKEDRFRRCALGAGLSWLLEHTQFSSASADLINEITKHEGTPQNLLAVTWLSESAPGKGNFSPFTDPNSNNSSDLRRWDYGPFQLNYRWTEADIKKGNYSAAGLGTELQIYGLNVQEMNNALRDKSVKPADRKAVTAALDTMPFGGSPLANGRLAARKLNFYLKNPNLTEEDAIVRYASTIARDARRTNYKNFNKPFQKFFDCYNQR